jgi:hypothetical protein
VARDAGLADRCLSRVFLIPIFEEAIEADEPPTVTTLAELRREARTGSGHCGSKADS